MKILAIETSCDETAVSILDCEGDLEGATFQVLGNALTSQVKTHAEYGGVHPSMAKREHAENILPLLQDALFAAGMLETKLRILPKEEADKIHEILIKEASLRKNVLDFVEHYTVPDIDAIAVTQGPGLEPALWIGLNFAHALSVAWNKQIVLVNHMEGHIASSMMLRQGKELVYKIPKIDFPLVALLISGAHTELVLAHNWLEYAMVGTTRDDAVGEAFDKVARLLGIPYPGGVGLQNLAEQARMAAHSPFHHPMTIDCELPRPMLKSPNCDFSFSGLKTAVLYMVRDIPTLDEPTKQKIAREFEDSVTEILTTKTRRAIDIHKAKTLVIGGGVAANTNIRAMFDKIMKEEYPNVRFYIPPKELTTDNAIMIAAAGYFRFLKGEAEKAEPVDMDSVRAEGNKAYRKKYSEEANRADGNLKLADKSIA
jgi:N6-L-threonylcarbamoyladenine synthase